MRKLYLWLSYAIGNSAVMTFVLLTSLSLFGKVVGAVITVFFAVIVLIGNTVALNDAMRLMVKKHKQDEDEEY